MSSAKITLFQSSPIVRKSLLSVSVCYWTFCPKFCCK